MSGPNVVKYHLETHKLPLNDILKKLYCPIVTKNRKMFVNCMFVDV
jgi:hypothetical protein